VGDLLVFAEEHLAVDSDGAPDTVAMGRVRVAVMELTNLDFGYLRRCQRVAARFPAATRWPRLSWAHHDVVMAFDDTTAVDLLAQAEEGGWTRDRLRSEARQAAAELGEVCRSEVRAAGSWPVPGPLPETDDEAPADEEPAAPDPEPASPPPRPAPKPPASRPAKRGGQRRGFAVVEVRGVWDDQADLALAAALAADGIRAYLEGRGVEATVTVR
jgi:hypothetical protein